MLDVQRRDRALEIGFGPGIAVREISRLAVEEYVCGLDHSEEMTRQATKRNAAAIRTGRVELRRVMRPGGRIAVTHQPRGPGATNATAAAKGEEIAAALTRAGFSEVHVHTMRLKPAVVCATGVNPARVGVQP